MNVPDFPAIPNPDIRITRREWVASMALQALIADMTDHNTWEDVAVDAQRAADELLAQLERTAK